MAQGPIPLLVEPRRPAYAAGGLPDAEGRRGFEALNTDNVSPVFPTAQQSSETQLPQTQQNSPNMDMVGTHLLKCARQKCALEY